MRSTHPSDVTGGAGHLGDMGLSQSTIFSRTDCTKSFQQFKFFGHDYTTNLLKMVNDQDFLLDKYIWNFKVKNGV